MPYLLYITLVVGIALFLYGMLKSVEEEPTPHDILFLYDMLKSVEEEPTPHDEKAEETPELAPDIYADALASLLIDATLRGLEQVQRNGDDEAGKGARV